MNALPMPNSNPAYRIHPAFARAFKVRVLSLDGGGMRAIIPAMILARLEQRLQEIQEDESVRMIDYFDFVSGTSAGAILACLYTLPDEKNPNRPKYSAREVLAMYLEGGMDTFARSSESRLEKYSSPHFEKSLQKCLGRDRKLEELIRPVLITAFNVDREAPVILESWQANKVKVWEAARASSAAPGLFKAAQITDSDRTG